MKYTLETTTQHVHDVRRQLAQLEERAGSQRQRFETLQSDYRAAQRAHSEATTAKTRILGEFGAGSASQAEVDRILDKINSHGFGALTPEEKRILDDAKDLLSRQ